MKLNIDYTKIPKFFKKINKIIDRDFDGVPTNIRNLNYDENLENKIIRK